MGAYKIKVNIELVECEGMEKEGDLIKNKNGSFSMTIREQDAVSMDKCEGSVLKTAYPSIREVLSNHLSEISKKKPSNKAKPEKSQLTRTLIEWTERQVDLKLEPIAVCLKTRFDIIQPGTYLLN